MSGSLIVDIWFYVLAVPAVISVGVSKAGVSGTAGIAVSLMALNVSVAQAAAILLPLLCLADIFTVWVYRGKYDPVNLKIIMPGAVLGTAAGTAGFHYLDPEAIKLMLGLIAIWFSVQNLFWQSESGEPAKPNRAKGTFWATMSGFTSFIIHGGSPPLNVYMVPQRLPRAVFVGTGAIFYMFLNYAKIGPYAWLGQLHVTNLMTSLVLVPVVPVGVLIGFWVQRTLSDKMFYRIILTVLFFVGVKLTYDGIKGLFF